MVGLWWRNGAKIELLHSVLPTRRAPVWRLSGFSKQFLEHPCSETHIAPVLTHKDLQGGIWVSEKPPSRTFVNRVKKRGSRGVVPRSDSGLANLTHTFVPATLEPRGARSPPG